jgi:hypothetical protein
LEEIRAKISTMTSVARSDIECTASAIMAPLRPRMPAASFRRERAILTTIPIQVTR